MRKYNLLISWVMIHNFDGRWIICCTIATSWTQLQTWKNSVDAKVDAKGIKTVSQSFQRRFIYWGKKIENNRLRFCQTALAVLIPKQSKKNSQTFSFFIPLWKNRETVFAPKYNMLLTCWQQDMLYYNMLLTRSNSPYRVAETLRVFLDINENRSCSHWHRQLLDCVDSSRNIRIDRSDYLICNIDATWT